MTDKWPDCGRILELAADPARQTRRLSIDRLDFSRPFIPEEFTQLYHTPLYRTLTREQRLRYNQLFAVRTNEYIMMLESDLVNHFLVPLRRNKAIRANPPLRACLDTMIAEERKHYQGFLALNRLCLPDVFRNGRERYFSELSTGSAWLLKLLDIGAGRLAYPLWYVMALEESSIGLARAMKRNPRTRTLGRLEPSFMAVHLEHMKDETRHLHTDRRLISACISAASPFWRRLDAALFKMMIREFTVIRRNGSGARVIRHLVREMPELAPGEEELITALEELKHNESYQRSLFSRPLMPLTFGIFDETEELAGLERILAGYDRPD